MSTPTHDRTLGEHDARLDALERDLGEIKSVVNEIRVAQMDMSEKMAKAQGGWRMLLVLMSCSAIGGGLMTVLFPWMPR